MKNKLSIKNALIGLSGLIAVVAPVATLVACGGKGTTALGKGTTALGVAKEVVPPLGVFPGSVAKLTTTEAIAFDEKTNTIDLEKVNNTYNLASMISKLSGIDQIKSIVDKYKSEVWANLATNSVIYDAYKDFAESLHTTFEKVKNIKQAFILKDGNHKDLIAFDLSKEAEAVLKSLERIKIAGAFNGIAIAKWTYNMSGQRIFTQGIPSDVTVDQAVEDEIHSSNGFLTSDLTPVLKDIFTNGKALYEKVLDQQKNINSTKFIVDATEFFGPSASYKIDGYENWLNNFPLPTLEPIFEIISKISDKALGIQETEAYKNWTYRTGLNPSKDSIIGQHLNSASYTDGTKNPDVVFNAALAFFVMYFN